MKGPWKCFSNTVNGRELYIAGRQVDLAAPLHSGNIEYRGGYIAEKADVEEWCEMKNAEEGYGKY